MLFLFICHSFYCLPQSSWFLHLSSMSSTQLVCSQRQLALRSVWDLSPSNQCCRHITASVMELLCYLYGPHRNRVLGVKRISNSTTVICAGTTNMEMGQTPFQLPMAGWLILHLFSEMILSLWRGYRSAVLFVYVIAASLDLQNLYLAQRRWHFQRQLADALSPFSVHCDVVRDCRQVLNALFIYFRKCLKNALFSSWIAKLCKHTCE